MVFDSFWVVTPPQHPTDYPHTETPKTSSVGVVTHFF